MQSLRIAYRNVLRGWRRTLLLGGAIAFGFFIFTLLNALTGGMVGTVSQNLASSLGGHLYVSGSEVSDLGSEVSVVRDTGTLETALGSLAGQVASYSARSSAQVGVIFGSREETTELIGVDFAQESDFLASLEFSAGSAAALSQNEAGIALPEALTQDLGIQVGESVVVRTTTITGQQNIGDFVVAGALAADEAFGPPGLAAQSYAHLGALNTLLGMEPGQYQSLNIYLNNLEGLETATTTLYDALAQTAPVEPRETGGGGLPNPADFLTLGGLSSVDEDERWQGTKFEVTNLNDELDSVFTIVTLINSIGLIVFVVILIIIMVGIINSYRMVMMERTAEIGTMRAMGVQREGVRNIFLWEALFVALGGTALGLALAAMAMVGLGFVTFPADGAFGIFLNEGRFAFDLSLLTTLSNIALVCLMSVAAVYLPARAAARLQPAEALRAG